MDSSDFPYFWELWGRSPGPLCISYGPFVGPTGVGGMAEGPLYKLHSLATIHALLTEKAEEMIGFDLLVLVQLVDDGQLPSPNGLVHAMLVPLDKLLTLVEAK